MTVQQIATTTARANGPAPTGEADQGGPAPARPVPLPSQAAVAPAAKPAAEQTSDEFATTLTAGRAISNGAYDVRLSELPVSLQALVRFIRRGIADVSSALERAGGDASKIPTQRLRGRLQTGARSWHQDSGGKVPASAGNVGPVAAFFQSWFENSDKPFPTKQLKKAELSDRLLREYTATGWKEAEQLGRLIYDPLDDVLYLTIKHYTDDTYVRIVGDARGHGAQAIAANHELTPEDLELLCFEAWSALELELDEQTGASLAAEEAARAPAPSAAPKPSAKGGPPRGGKADKAPPKATPSAAKVERTPPKKSAEPDGGKDGVPSPEAAGFDALDPQVQEALKVLHVARRDYQRAYAEAVRSQKFQQSEKERIDKAKKTTAAEPASKDEVTAPFDYRGTTFHVGHKAGYIGYVQAPKGKPQKNAPAPKPIFPAYTTEVTTVEDVAKVFQLSLRTTPASDEATALMLAALVAESSRHRAAMVESVLVAVGHAGLGGKSQKAFGTALPMAAGGTIATGGVAASVLARESETARGMVLGVLSPGRDDETALRGLLEELKPADRVPKLVAALREALSSLY